MTQYADLLLVILLGLDLYMVSTGRIDQCVRATVLQAIVMAVLPFALVSVEATTTDLLHLGLLAVLTIGVKAVFIPYLLFKALRGLGTNREFAPFVSLHVSQVVNGVLVSASFWIASVLPWPSRAGSPLAVGVGLATLLVGLYMTINRRKALSQILGYLVAESGIFVIGWALLGRPSLIVELGVLLDVLVAIMVMGVLATSLDTGDDEAAPRKEDAWRR